MKKQEDNRKNETYLPLLDDADGYNGLEHQDEDKHKLFKKNPFENSFIISKLFFSWVTPLARVNYITLKFCRIWISWFII
jgi:hypothetical protein